MSNNRVLLSGAASEGFPSLEKMADACSLLLDHLQQLHGSGPYELSVTLADDEAIQAINREHRNKDAPTDVLSFPMLDFSDNSEDFPVDEAEHAFVPPTSERSARSCCWSTAFCTCMAMTMNCRPKRKPA